MSVRFRLRLLDELETSLEVGGGYCFCGVYVDFVCLLTAGFVLSVAFSCNSGWNKGAVFRWDV